MKYEELYNDFISMFPGDLDYFSEREKETGADSECGMHVVFGMVVVPFVAKIVKESPDKAKKAFDYFEKMETSGDPKIAEVVEFTILENLLTEDKEAVPEYEKYFGEETKVAAKAVGKWFN